MKRAVIFVLLLSMELIVHSQNLVANPGFEKWQTITRPEGWSVTQNCQKDSVSFQSGIYSCLHFGGTTSAKYLGQTIPVIPRKQYRLSLLYKTAVTGTGNGCRIWCYWKDEAGNSITDASTDDILRPSKYLKSDTWQPFSTEVIAAPSNAASFYLEVRTYQNSITNWDDFVFEEYITAGTMK
jgi:hypothetical protein